MTTSYNLKEELEKERKRSKPSSISATIAKVAFSD